MREFNEFPEGSSKHHPYPWVAAWSMNIGGKYIVLREDQKYYCALQPLCAENNVVAGPFDTLEAAKAAYMLIWSEYIT